MKAILKQDILYDDVEIYKGDEGEVVEDIKHIPNYCEYYDLYVQFGNNPAIGLFKEEVNVIDANR